jgi:hypothetical protein
MNRFAYIGLALTTSVTLSFVGCTTAKVAAPSNIVVVNTTPSTPVTVSTISDADLNIIQGAATVATGAVLQFLETTPSSRSDLANQIYASANALYSLSTGVVPSGDQINATILSFSSSNPVANYTQYAAALSGIYAAELAKFGPNSKNAIAILGAIAQGAQNGAKVYVSTPLPVK